MRAGWRAGGTLLTQTGPFSPGNREFHHFLRNRLLPEAATNASMLEQSAVEPLVGDKRPCVSCCAC